MKTTETQPLPTDAERAAFEAEWHRITGETALTWEAVCVSAGEPVPAHCADRYFSRAVHTAWLLWQAACRTPAPVGVEPVAWRVRRLDSPNYWIIFLHKPVDALMDPKREVQPLYTAPQPTQAQAGSVTADDLKQPRNGAQWRVEWWNESCRMLLPANKRLDSFQTYRNGTLMFTIKEKSGIKGGQHGADT